MIDPMWMLRYGMASAQDRDAGAEAARSGARAGAAVNRTRALEDRIDRLTLVCAALWSLVKDKTGLAEQDLLERVQQLDLADGVADGKCSRAPRQCPHCGRINSPRHPRCLYCGTPREDATAFDTTG